jgi:hypothetical protein
MAAVSAKALKAAFPNASDGEIRRVLRGIAATLKPSNDEDVFLTRFKQSNYLVPGTPWALGNRARVAMEAAGTELNRGGVEVLRVQDVPVAVYLRMPNERPTLFYEFKTGRFLLTSYDAWIKANGALGRVRRGLGLLGSMFGGPFDAKNREAALRKMVEAQKDAMKAEAAAEAAPDDAKLAVQAAEAVAEVEEQEEEVSPAERVLIEKMATEEAAEEGVPAAQPVKKKKSKSSTRVTAKADDSPAIVAITERYRTWRKALGRGDVEEAESAYSDIRTSIDDDKVEPRWSAKQRAAFNRWTPPRRCGWGMLGSLFKR